MLPRGLQIGVGLAVDSARRELIQLGRAFEDSETQGDSAHNQENYVDNLTYAEEVRAGSSDQSSCDECKRCGREH